ncbi:MAG TPA: hypothetical protein VFC46_09565, partial [Humisphaera sp.]|nr:hypothetical protein [Humisphaera sp.]
TEISQMFSICAELRNVNVAEMRAFDPIDQNRSSCFRFSNGGEMCAVGAEDNVTQWPAKGAFYFIPDEPERGASIGKDRVGNMCGVLAEDWRENDSEVFAADAIEDYVLLGLFDRDVSQVLSVRAENRKIDRPEFWTFFAIDHEANACKTAGDVKVVPVVRTECQRFDLQIFGTQLAVDYRRHPLIR